MTGDNLRRALRLMSPDDRRILQEVLFKRLGEGYDLSAPLDVVLEAVRLDLIDSDMEDQATEEDLNG